ncbi:hypothetical protein [Streptomyces sp. NPDC047928]|uniref:hypothetical protein n=1 Tax=unclassified Streptomyces TaxID=2593676 RepID=UPI00371FE024
MPSIVTGTSRVTVVSLLHTWPDRYCLLAYAGTGHYGDTAVIGHIPEPGVAEVSLMDVAARHEPQRLYGNPVGRPDFAAACWLICTGWSGRGTPGPGTVDIPSAAWTLQVERTVELGQSMYGHERLHVGRLRFDDPALLASRRPVSPA